MKMPGRKTPPALILYKTALTAVDWLFPPECGGCGVSGTRWCAECNGEIESGVDSMCQVCGLPNVNHKRCSVCSRRKRGFDAARSLGIYAASLRNAVLKLKYKRDYGLGEILSNQMLELIDQLGWAVNAVVPVPLGKVRKKVRGYNQANLLARPIAMGLGLPLQTRLLGRTRETLSQVGLTESERWENVSHAFDVNENITKGTNYLLVDDVMTTGATLDSCAGALKKAGANKVYGITVARALDTRTY